MVLFDESVLRPTSPQRLLTEDAPPTTPPELICGDTDLLLPQMVAEGRTFDLILTDPPYNLDKDFGDTATDRLPFEEFLAASKHRIENAASLLSPTGSLVWFSSHRYLGFQQVQMYEVGLHYRRTNIWYYRNGSSRARRVPKPEYDPFLWFSKSGEEWTYNADDVRVPYVSVERLQNPVWRLDKDGNRRQWRPDPRGALRGDVWEEPALAGKAFAGERTDHPTQKPVALFVDLVKAFCPKDVDGRYTGTVLDPFLGSGTTAVACEQLNQMGHDIRFTGIEIESRWVDVAEVRIAGVHPALF